MYPPYYRNRHVEQDLIPAQALDRARLIAVEWRVKLGFHPEKLEQYRDIPVVGLPGGGHGSPLFY